MRLREIASVVFVAFAIFMTTSSGVLTCPSSYTDGCAGAPAGSIQFPHLLDVNSSGTQTYGATFVARPPWNVPGVDYYVGVPTGYAAKDPATNCPGSGVTCNNSTHIYTISANNVTLDGYDFSLEGGWQVNLPNTFGNLTVTNSHFKEGANLNTPIVAPAGSGNLTVTKTTLDVNSVNDTNFQDAISYNGTGTLKVQYCYFANTWQHGINVGATATLTLNWNLFYNIGVGTGTHPDIFYFFSSGTLSGSNVGFNTYYQDTAVVNGNPALQWTSDNSASSSMTINNNAGGNNVLVGRSGKYNYIFRVFQDNGGWTVSNNSLTSNYFDTNAAAFGVWEVASGAGTYGSGNTSANNVSLTTGSVVTSPFSN